jgi:hypothetical protein
MSRSENIAVVESYLEFMRQGIYASGGCEEIGRRIKVATVVEMVQPLDCKREPITRSSAPGIDRSFPTDSAHR